MINIINFTLVLLLIAFVITNTNIHLKYLMFIIVTLFLMIRNIPEDFTNPKKLTMDDLIDELFRNNDTYSVDELSDKIRKLDPIYKNCIYIGSKDSYNKDTFEEHLKLINKMMVENFQDKKITKKDIIELYYNKLELKNSTT